MYNKPTYINSLSYKPDIILDIPNLYFNYDITEVYLTNLSIFFINFNIGT